MGETAENVATRYQITRAQQEAFALTSQAPRGERAGKAAASTEEIVPITPNGATVSRGRLHPRRHRRRRHLAAPASPPSTSTAR